ncbi:M20/M25/M40 family metallo-hydrolase [Pelagicoccus mobilis]|uniref:M20/M25/M40 family metallo-hydrolase n=1 Tax=Pelagicoccus mobilis TaxID=415221 RepID=A0A934RZS6_9BACT|nr:M20/M25/M40 family metallo-hydrolase [Pelagicoccus mobilis]MBK1879656.1 M20/M25/M40 family metallo-hydrolase [Pelagicoccus mobilis]
MSGELEVNELELLRDLVAINSVNPVYGGPGEGGVADYLQERLRAKGIEFQRQAVLPGRENLYARIGPDDAPALLLEAHMDTVGVEGWASGSPFDLSEREGRFYGRGSCDTKASLACFLLTLERFAEAPERLNRALVFAASVDEESEQLGAFELAKLKEELGIAWAITGEPTRSDVISRHKGVGRYLVSTSGKAAHASTPELGENAIYKAARLCGRLEQYGESLHSKAVEEEIDRGTMNVGVIGGGIGFNIVPDRCQLDIDRRLGRRESAELARSELEAICAAEPGAELTVFLERPPLVGERSGEFVEELLGAGDVLGFGLKERQVPYMTNAVAYEGAGIPSVVFGPGDIAQAHKNDEFIERGQMARCLSVLDAFLSGDR